MSSTFSSERLCPTLGQKWQNNSSLKEDPHPKIVSKLNSFLKDFQQPLTVISVTAQLGQLRDHDEETQEDLNIILGSVNQLRLIVTQMREALNARCS